MSSPSLYAVGAGARTKRLRIGPMGYIVPLYHPLRLAEEIAIVDQMLGGRMELGLVPGINPDYFRPFGLDYGQRKSPTLEFVDYLRAAFGEAQPFSFHGQDFHTDNAQISVRAGAAPASAAMDDEPRSADARILRQERASIPAISWSIRAPTRRRATANSWPIGRRPAGAQKPNIAYCTVVYVDETDDKAIDTALFRASRAYEGFLAPPKPGETFEERAKEHAKMFVGRGEPGASEIMQHLFDADYLFKNDLVFIGSPQTVAAKIRAAAQAGVFNVFMGEFNFADLPEEELMRSIRLFGEKVIPALRDLSRFEVPAANGRERSRRERLFPKLLEIDERC